MCRLLTNMAKKAPAKRKSWKKHMTDMRSNAKPGNHVVSGWVKSLMRPKWLFQNDLRMKTRRSRNPFQPDKKDKWSKDLSLTRSLQFAFSHPHLTKSHILLSQKRACSSPSSLLLHGHQWSQLPSLKRRIFPKCRGEKRIEEERRRTSKCTKEDKSKKNKCLQCS